MDLKAGSGRKSAFGKWILMGIFATGIVVFLFFDLGRFLTLELLRENKDGLRIYTESHYALVVILYIVIYCVQTTFSLPGAAILTLAGGFLFGILLGTLYVNIGATSGATLAFLVARYLFRDAVERRFGEKLASFHRGFERNDFNYLITIRLIPIFPFFLVNLGSGLTRIRLSTYVAATAIGIIPGSFVYSNAGKQLGTINSLKDIASPGVVGAFVVLGLLALVPVFYQRLKKTSVTGHP